MTTPRAQWYIDRLTAMSVREVVWRAGDCARKVAWAPRRVPPPDTRRPGVSSSGLTDSHPPAPKEAVFESTIDLRTLEQVPQSARRRVVEAAERALAGRYEVLGVPRDDLENPDWFYDPVTGRRAPQNVYCFRVDHRRQEVTGNVKQVWELSRHQHLTVLAAAFAFTGDERFAERVASQLRSWWAENPFLSGIHWTSGIELGLRLISWVWTRRLLDSWSKARSLFENDELALRQIWWHQRYLEGFRSRGSSANNHVIAEAAGALVAALGFPWFEESSRWALRAASTLEDELAKNCFPSGVNREMAFGYHGFVAELGLVAALEADRAGKPLGVRTWELLARMLDVVAAVLDSSLRAPRYGDDDDGRALVLDATGSNRWGSLLALGRGLFGAPGWWPCCVPDTTSTLLGSLGHPRELAHPERRPDHFEDAGITIMRNAPPSEIWCRCDAGPHGFLSIAAHAHADALSVEVRHAGVDILADPGTYCYQGHEKWRSYFRSTLGHNTVEIAHRDQSVSGGATLWTKHASTRLVGIEQDQHGAVVSWTAEHCGYAATKSPAHHRRTVSFSPEDRRVTIVDLVRTSRTEHVRLAFHLGPEVEAQRVGGVVELSWTYGEGLRGAARVQLPDSLCWRLARGETSPVVGWYSERFGCLRPATTLVGEGRCVRELRLETEVQFLHRAQARAGSSLAPAAVAAPFGTTNEAARTRSMR